MEKLTQKQKILLEFLNENKSCSFTENEIKNQLNIGKSVIESLVKKNLILETIENINKFNYTINLNNIKLNVLNSEQQNVIQEIKQFIKNKNKTILLEGATGSGKTEVYFHLIYEMLLNNSGQILFLIPEIALGTQLILRFEEQFKCKIAVWHSNINDSNKQYIWNNALNGEIKIIIGARSSLFLPFKNLQLIIVDEEHDNSYKQTDNGCYNARDMAILKAKINDATTILGSATPSLESLLNVENGKYKKVYLQNRFGGAIHPDIKLIDLTKEKFEKGSIISNSLKVKIQEHLNNNNQVLLFLNKRGYSPLVLCKECGFKYTCPNCSSYLTNHKNNNQLICHQCGYILKNNQNNSQNNSQNTVAVTNTNFNVCPTCGKNSIISFGCGVEKIEEEMKQLFPKKNTAIITSDTMQNINKTKQMLDDIINRKIDIIIGTQIITKGYHFPDLTLVGVLDADATLFGGQFKGIEKTYQLLTQVIGRAGRAEKSGEALIQTYSPENIVMQALKNNDKTTLIDFDKQNRELMQVPPFGKIALILVSDINQEKAYNKIKEIIKFIPVDDNIEILGPAPTFIYKLNKNYRFKIIIKAKNNINIQKLILFVLGKVNMQGVKFKIDINPNEIP